MSKVTARPNVDRRHGGPAEIYGCSPETRRHWSHLMPDFNRLETPRPRMSTDDGGQSASNTAIVERNCPTRFIVPIVQWCAALVDSDHRRHDHRRLVQFWGDE